MKNVETPIDLPVDKNGWTMRPPITDEALIVLCLRNAPEGVDRKQVQRLVEKFE